MTSPARQAMFSFTTASGIATPVQARTAAFAVPAALPSMVTARIN
jgi:hypothetical protein